MGRDVRNRARIAELERALKQAAAETNRVEKSFTKAERKRRELRDANADLTRRLGSAHGALEAYRKETARLKEDLQRLRGSRSYRIGRNLVDPFGLRSVRASQEALPVASSTTAAAQPAADPRPATSASPRQNTALGAADLPPAPDSLRTEDAPRLRRLSEWSYEELLEWLEREPGPDSLKAVLSRSWYAEGQFSRPAELLEAHEEIAAQLTGKDAVLAERILGAARAKEQGFTLPPRARGAAYLPERDRIMYCAHSTAMFNTNGYSIRTHGMAKGLAMVNEDVFVVGRPGYPWDSATDIAKPATARHTGEIEGISYVHLPGSPLSSTPFDRFILEAADAYVREARLLRPSLIHSASNFWTALPALIAARRLGIPFVYEVRGLWEITEASDKSGWEQTERYSQQVRLETLVATEADSVLAITEETKDELVRRGVPTDRISLAPNAVDTSNYLPLPKDEAYARRKGVRTDLPVIGFAGSMVRYEGLHLLLEAASTLAEQEDSEASPGFQVVLAGSGRAEDDLKAMARDLGIADRVRFLGRLPNSEMPQLISLFDIMPLPRLSLPVTEMVSPLKPLEALSSGKAVVLSDVSPHRVFAGAGQERGRLFTAGDADSLATVLAELIADQDTRTTLGREGRLWCLDNRTWERVAGGVTDVHDRAQASHDHLVSAVSSRELSSLRVGLVADEFTSSTLQATVQVTPLERASWRDQLGGLHLVFIESAWSGNGGQWHRGVGRYSAEEHRDIKDLLAAARELGIPSVFWNKEDPVHFNRFVATASLCDHVFTTDAGRIPAYLTQGEGQVATASALPFYAQPKIHNPLPTDRPFDASIAYAGTYYGDRYAQRSRELAAMLSAAKPHGLTIYDRQASLPDSPYHFPPQFEAHVRGSLPYDDVLKSYKSHVASINVNSVADSPSMFSRRVVEIAASGGVVLSGPGRGVSETFGSAIPCTGDPVEWRAYFRAWTTDSQARLTEAWRQMRAVSRGHTVGTALTIVARTAGLTVTGPELPSYALALQGTSPDELSTLVESLLAQSVLPAEVLVAALDRPDLRDTLQAAGITVVDDADDFSAEFVGSLTCPVPRTWFEDLICASAYGDWQGLACTTPEALTPDAPIARPTDQPPGRWDLVARPHLWQHDSLDEALAATPLHGLHLAKPLADAPLAAAHTIATPQTVGISTERTRILVAGHDLKFAQSFIDSLREQGFPVEIDQWQSHTDHDEERSQELLRSAHVVFCEWGLGNAEWYSKHVGKEQRLIVRVHSQELRRPYLSRIKHDNVAAYIFVGSLIREAAVRGHGVPRNRTVVIPNGVPVDALQLPKTEEADRTIGLVGILPQSKRLDLALDVLEGLQQHDPSYRLRVRGKLPSELPWLAQRPLELQYFEDQFTRIDALNSSRPDSVLMEGHDDNMTEWYRHIGIALSVSDFESFHLTIADGAASGAMPALLAWPGADLIYPRDWICASTDEIVKRVLYAPRTPEVVQDASKLLFNAQHVNDALTATVVG
nr:glycosyltransferase [Ornithinimicrobium sp. HY1793]